jgi:hypothetical protein
LNDIVVENTNAQTMFLLTWGHRNGVTGNEEMFPDFTTMQGLLTEGYLRYVQATSTRGRPTYVAPAGLVFETIYNDLIEQGEDPMQGSSLFWRLYGDGRHPSSTGSYLAALTIYTTMTGRNPKAIRWVPEDVDVEDARIVKDAVARTILFLKETEMIDFPWQTPWSDNEPATGGGGTATPKPTTLAPTTPAPTTPSPTTLAPTTPAPTTPIPTTTEPTTAPKPTPVPTTTPNPPPTPTQPPKTSKPNPTTPPNDNNQPSSTASVTKPPNPPQESNHNNNNDSPSTPVNREDIPFYPGEPDFLFLGDGYTGWNRLNGMTGSLLAESIPEWYEPMFMHALVSVGGTFARHLQEAENEDDDTPQREALVTRPKEWKWVILQEQSQIPGLYEYGNQPGSEFYDSKVAAQELNELIAATGGQTMFFMTWGRRDGDPGNPQTYPDFLTMQGLLTEGYLQYVQATSTPTRPTFVAPVGMVFQTIYTDHVAAAAQQRQQQRQGGDEDEVLVYDPATDRDSLFYQLYRNDGSNPSVLGTYVAALTIYATMTGLDPKGLEYAPDEIEDPIVIAALQDAVSRTMTFLEQTQVITFPWQLSRQQQARATVSPSGGDKELITLSSEVATAEDTAATATTTATTAPSLINYETSIQSLANGTNTVVHNASSSTNETAPNATMSTSTSSPVMDDSSEPSSFPASTTVMPEQSAASEGETEEEQPASSPSPTLLDDNEEGENPIESPSALSSSSSSPPTIEEGGEEENNTQDEEQSSPGLTDAINSSGGTPLWSSIRLVSAGSMLVACWNLYLQT